MADLSVRQVMSGFINECADCGWRSLRKTHEYARQDGIGHQCESMGYEEAFNIVHLALRQTGCGFQFCPGPEVEPVQAATCVGCRALFATRNMVTDRR